MLPELQQAWEQTLNRSHITYVLSLGTPDHFQKTTGLLLDRRGNALAVAKIGCTPQAKNLIRHEYNTLVQLNGVGVSRSIIPFPLGCGTTGAAGWMLQSVLDGGRPSPAYIRKEHLDFLAELSSLKFIDEQPGRESFWEGLKKSALQYDDREHIDAHPERSFFAELLERAEGLITDAQRQGWPLVASHGDFAPWNIRLIGGRAAVFDWEYFLPAAPAGWDLTRFIILVEHLLHKKSLRKIQAGFPTNRQISEWEAVAELRIPDRSLLAKLFILDLLLDATRTSIGRVDKPAGKTP